jgi:hypothetical protein
MCAFHKFVMVVSITIFCSRRHVVDVVVFSFWGCGCCRYIWVQCPSEEVIRNNHMACALIHPFGALHPNVETVFAMCLYFVCIVNRLLFSLWMSSQTGSGRSGIISSLLMWSVIYVVQQRYCPTSQKTAHNKNDSNLNILTWTFWTNGDA